MAVRLKELIDLLEAAAPPQLKEPWDNPGLAVGDPDQLIDKVMVGMDVTKELIEEARAAGAQLLLTHHPLLFLRPDAITPATAQGTKLRELIRHDLAAYSAHTNLDKVKGGMNDDLMALLGFSDWTILDEATPEGDGIGRSAVIEAIPLQELARSIAGTLEAASLRFAGDPARLIRSVAVINGSGAEFIQMAADKGIDCVITGDTKYHEVLDALDMGVSVIDPGHFASEWKIFARAMARVQSHAQEQLGACEFIYSVTARDPYRRL